VINISTSKKIYKLLDFVDQKWGKNLFKISVASLALASFEVLNALLLSQYFGLLMDVDLKSSQYLFMIANHVGIGQLYILLIFLSISILCLMVLGLYLNTLTNSLSSGYGTNLSIMLYEIELYSDFENSLKKKSGEIISGIAGKSKVVANNMIMPWFNMLSGLILVLTMFGFALRINVYITISTTLFVGGLYVIINNYTSKLIKNEGLIANKESTELIGVIQEMLSDIRNVFLSNLGGRYLEKFSNKNFILRDAQRKINIYSTSPKYFVEGIMLAYIVIISFVLYSWSDDKSTIILTMAALTFLVMRIVPNVNKIFYSINLINSTVPVLDDIINSLDEPIKEKCLEAIDFKICIEFINVSFRYKDVENRNHLFVKNIKINKGDKVGILGKTGSGKSTFLDLLSGLLIPDSGQILIDGAPLKRESLKSWGGRISYLSQTVNLNRGSIIDNVTHLSLEDSHDLNLIHESLRSAAIFEEFRNLNLNDQNLLGDNGAGLSGGQKQRLALARTLYKKSDILIMDEATSAIDKLTEDEILKNIFLDKNKTIIMVSHSESAMKHCDYCLIISDGVVNVV
jgi:ATP-binding cassette subfamily B protein